jgi:hypothetical protein
VARGRPRRARARPRGGDASDATNAYGGRNEQFESLAHEVKAIVGGPTAKAFNLNFARLYDEAARQETPPGNFIAADDGAREIAEQLTRDAGYEPLFTGGLDRARALEDFLGPAFGVGESVGGPYFYRVTRP